MRRVRNTRLSNTNGRVRDKKIESRAAPCACGSFISYVAFPFPLRQLLLWLLLVFNLMAPITIASFMKSEFFVAVLSFFVCLGTRAGSSSNRTDVDKR